MIGRESVTFRNALGEQLIGILDLPSGQGSDIAILLLSPGVKMRVGPSQLYHALSRVFVDQGFPVLRFDFNGLGDSEGEISEDRLVDIYNSIVNGRYITDTKTAIEWIQDNLGYRRVIVAGLCGGAMTGMLTAAEDSRIVALVGLGIPVAFDGGEADYWRYATANQLRGLKGRYTRNLFKPKSWIRFLTFRSDYRLILKVIHRFILDRMRGRSTTPTTSTQKTGKAPNNTNPKFAPSFFTLLRNNRKILLLFGEKDRLVHEFSEKFEQPNRHDLDPFSNNYEVVRIPEANHILSSPAARDTMAASITAWLRRHFSADEADPEDLSVRKAPVNEASPV